MTWHHIKEEITTDEGAEETQFLSYTETHFFPMKFNRNGKISDNKLFSCFIR